ncbi:DNA-binding protein [Arcticibacterium luteifluviistationis]|uniref:DNA-binding protein n=2 Tax=Arcticibacterium luteifluviistationis TaxID=1784714 RepID=A0A2Z4GCS1_9BACT|nr:DUF3276 family protein [Arcticibacterium luteifluviistationis]AWV98961.1 DNA-binding protein [Arcticibacterium luteifluviistationis]
MQNEEREMIYSKRVRAGKRTYFFDVRATRANDYYLTVTESRRQQRDGDFFYEKSKMFIYKEDFNKFVDALQETVDHIKTELLPEFDFEQFDNKEDSEKAEAAAPIVKEVEKDSEITDIDSDSFGDSELKWE